MSPWKSEQQRRWGHSTAGIKALGGMKKVKEWDKLSKGKKLRRKVKPKK